MTDEQKKPIDLTEEELMAEDEIIPLINEDGESVNFYHTATLQHEDKWYVVLQPAEEMEDIAEDEVVIFGLQEDENGEDLFLPIEDQSLLDAVFEKFQEMTGCDCDCDGCDCDDDDDADAEGGKQGCEGCSGCGHN